MKILYLVLSAACFASGGLYMKQSNGATVFAPTVTFLALFTGGALLQARAMQRAEMGPVYLAVLGLEATLAIVFSLIVLHERFSWSRGLAVSLILGGVALLRAV